MNLNNCKNRLGTGIASACILLSVGLLPSSDKSALHAESAAQQAVAQLTFDQDGNTYAIVDGDVYQVEAAGPPLFLGHLYDPNFFQTNYRTTDGGVFRVDPDTGTLYPVSRTFSDGFEGTKSILNMLTPERWHSHTADPRRAGDQDNYYNLGNRLTLSTTLFRSGLAAMKCYAVPSANDVSKASISKGNMYFKKGDNVSFSGWFYVQNTPSLYDAGGFTLFDLESTFFTGSVGMRVIFRENDSLAFELKLPKTQFTQNKGSEVRFPTGRWVKVETRLFLSDTAGRVRIWQDGKLVLDKAGRTLPLADTVYDKFEVGISALAQGSAYQKVVFVDDVAISAVQ